MDSAEPRRIQTEVFGVTTLLGLCTFGLSFLRQSRELEPWIQLGVAFLFLWTSFRLAQRDPQGLRAYGLDFAGLMEPAPNSAARSSSLVRDTVRAAPVFFREMGVALGVMAILFPPFIVGFHLWHAPTHPFVWHVPLGLGSQIMAQLLLVALPEEAFFRGYVQTRLSQAYPQRVQLLGVSINPQAWLLQATLFALMHLTMTPWAQRLAVFFPGLLFGWVRVWRGGVGACIVLHAGCNLVAEFLVHGWLI